MSEKHGTIRKRLFMMIAVLFAALLAFFGLFYITEVEVVGNSRYTEEQISEMALQGPLAYNTVLMSVFKSTLHPDAAFVESIHVAFRSRNKIRLEVQEKYPIGDLEIDGSGYYFDKNGLVLEVIAETNEKSGEEEDAEQSLKADPAVSESTDTVGTLPAAGNSSDTSFRPALTDVPLITGLEVSNVQVGQVIETPDPSVFQVILSLTKLIDKFDIRPDQVAFSGSNSMTLYYDTVRIQIGDDSYLEEKISRVAAILPELRGLSGVLHLEEYTKETQNIIFDRDQTDMNQSQE